MEQPFYNNGITIIAILSLFITCILMTIKILFKSKCVDVSILYGLIHIQRNTSEETEIIDQIPQNQLNTNMIV